MRTWGRVPVSGGDPADYVWIEVDTDANGNNDAVWLTTLIQVLKLNYGESPIYGNYGIPGYASVMNQIVPDYYATLAQQQFSQYFVTLNLARRTLTDSPSPTYDVSITANPGSILQNPVPV